MSGGAVVDVQEVVHGVVAHVDVRLAVAVDVHGEHPQPLASVHAAGVQAGLHAHVAEFAVAEVREQLVRKAVELLGRANVGRVAVVGAGRVLGPGPIDVLVDVKVGIAVAVEVGPGGAGRPGDPRQAGLFGHVHELAAPGRVLGVHRLVVEQGDAAPAGDEQVGPAVAVVVGHGRPVRVEPRVVRQADLLGHVPELEMALVVIELARPADDGLVVGAGVAAAAGHEQVEPAIPVVVDQGDAAAERFEDGHVARRFTGVVHFAVTVGDVDAGLFRRHFAEKGRPFRSGIVRDRGVGIHRGRRRLAADEQCQSARQQQGDGRPPWVHVGPAFPRKNEQKGKTYSVRARDGVRSMGRLAERTLSPQAYTR